jgi:hypothetical protein
MGNGDYERQLAEVIRLSGVDTTLREFDAFLDNAREHNARARFVAVLGQPQERRVLEIIATTLALGFEQGLRGSQPLSSPDTDAKQVKDQAKRPS